MTVFNNPEGKPNANRLAELMHPSRQNMVITEVVDENSTMKTYTLKASDNHELAYFKAGSYIPVYVEIDGTVVERPYALASSPKEALEGIYKISIKKMPNGYVSNYIHENWTIGTEITLGGPCPGESYQPLRDKKNVIALAGGVGVTPFHSIAQAIVDGDVDCSLTLIYGVNTLEEIAYAGDWKDLEAKSNGKFKCVIVIANETVEGYEHGFISLDIIQKYGDINDSSLFISGPAGMVKHINSFLEPLNLKRRYIRYGLNGDSEFNSNEMESETVTLTVHSGEKTLEVVGNKNETILASLEKAGLVPPAHCRSGICGFCRSYVVNGNFKAAIDETGMRARDKELGYVHPCCSYPTTDMEIIVPRG